MTAPGESTSVGSIVAYLRMNDSDWQATIADAKRKADDLGRSNPNIKISTNAATAIAQLKSVAVAVKSLEDAQVRLSTAQSKLTTLQNSGKATAEQLASASAKVASAQRGAENASLGVAAAYAKAQETGEKAAAAQDKLAASTDSMSKSSKDAKANVSLLAIAAVGLGPAIIPIAALAATGGAALGVMGVTGILAVKGIQTEMKAGTPIGLAYANQLGQAKKILGNLEQTGAIAFFHATDQAVGMLQTQFPQLNGQVSQFATIGGDVADHVLSAMFSGFQTLEPLLLMVAKGIDGGAASLDKWAGGGGLQKFEQWGEKNLPTLARAVLSIAQAVVNLGIASSGQGMIATQALQMVSDVINSIPLPILSKLVTLAATGYLAFKAWAILGALSTTVAGFTASVVALAAAEEGAVGAGLAAKLAQTGFVTSLGAGSAGAAAALGPLALLTAAVLLYKNALDKPNAVQNSMASGSPSGRSLLSYVGLDPAYKQQQAWKKQDAADQAAADAKQQAAVDALNRSIGTYNSTIDLTARHRQTSVAAETAYATELGFTQAAITAGTRSTADMMTQTGELSAQYANATPALRGYLDALQTYSQSAGTAADKGALIGATLKASQGDALGYAGSMVSAATANQSLVSSFDAAQKATVNWKTGVIDFRNAGSAPLIQNLQALQDAATGAATATYEHEVATKGAKDAASDAAAVFKNDTYNALIADATQLGLTADQAGALAKQYFNMPKSVTTKVIDEGTKDVITTLDHIGDLLAGLVGKPWTSVLSVDKTQAEIDLASFQTRLANLSTASAGLGYTESTGGGRKPAVASATGGYIRGAGTGTSDSIPARLSNGEFVINAKATAANRGLLESINAQRFETGGFVGVAAPQSSTSAAKAAASKSAAAAKAAATLAGQQANIRFSLSSDVPKVMAAALGTVSAISSAFASLINQVHAGISKGVGSNALVAQLQADNTQLQAVAAKRASLATQIQTWTAKLAADEASYNQEKSTVASAVTGGFNITSLTDPNAASFSPFSGSAPAGNTIASAIQQLQSRASAAKGFTSELSSLAGKGLPPALLQQLAEAGVDTGGASAKLLAGASKAQIGQITSLWNQVNASGTAAGGLVAGKLYSSAIKSDATKLGSLQQQEVSEDRLAAKIAAATAKAVAGIGVKVSTDSAKYEGLIKAEIVKDKSLLTSAAGYFTS